MSLIGPTVLYPFITALIFIGGARVLWKDQWETSRLYLVGIGLSFGFLVGYFAINTGFSASRISSTDRIFFAVSIAGLTAFLYHIWIARLRRFLLMPPATLLILLLLIQPLLERMPLAEAVPVITIAFLIWRAAGTFLTRNASKHTSNSSFLATAIGAAIIISLDGSLLIGQIAGALAAAMGAWWVLNQTQNWHEALGKASMNFLQLILGSILILAYFYADVSPIALLLVACVPFLQPIGEHITNAFEITAPIIQSCIVGLISFIPILIALWLIWPEESLY